MVLPGFLLFAASIFAIPSALAADCFTAEPAFGFQASELQQAADQVCDYGPTAYVTLPRLYKGYPMVVMASYNGSAKIYCMEAFQNIISQCLPAGRNGGWWDWNDGSDQETYTIEGSLKSSN